MASALTDIGASEIGSTRGSDDVGGGLGRELVIKNSASRSCLNCIIAFAADFFLSLATLSNKCVSL